MLPSHLIILEEKKKTLYIFLFEHPSISKIFPLKMLVKQTRTRYGKDVCHMKGKKGTVSSLIPKSHLGDNLGK